MSSEQTLIVDGSRLPDLASLSRVIDSYGTPIEFPADFRLDQSHAAYVQARVDGREALFAYDIHPLEPLVEAGEEPEKLLRYGNQLIHFDIRGLLSGFVVDQIVRALVQLGDAAAWNEGVLETPVELSKSEWPTLSDYETADERLAKAQASPKWEAAIKAEVAKHPEWAAKPPKSAFDKLVIGLWVVGGLFVTGLLVQALLNA